MVCNHCHPGVPTLPVAHADVGRDAVDGHPARHAAGRAVRAEQRRPRALATFALLPLPQRCAVRRRRVAANDRERGVDVEIPSRQVVVVQMECESNFRNQEITLYGHRFTRAEGAFTLRVSWIRLVQPRRVAVERAGEEDGGGGNHDEHERAL
jgi:hypothetical protein